ncbi:MAG: pyridoxamine 5'-phosphate oxidase family protein [bacterium]|nr:pyridoxamine 5'-phosphate oxidase family protein [bacterium]MCP4798818.1 pyridoxamine 5'-phosphate oxidase family protein [bacterium]
MHNMRRSDRAIEKEEALQILQNGEFGVLSTVGSDNQPYGFPVNFCVIGENIYFHCAFEGHKIDNFTFNPKVSFCVIGNTCVLPSKFSTEYESTIVFGLLSEVFDSEKQDALEGLVRKYSSEHLTDGLKYIDKQKGNTKVFRIAIETITGKARKRAR